MNDVQRWPDLAGSRLWRNLSPPASTSSVPLHTCGRRFPYNGVVLAKLLVIAISSAAAFAASGPGKVFPYTYTQEDLPNGLRLITMPTDFANIVATYIVVQTGSRNEVEPGHTGFAHLFEHLMFQGTEKYPPEKYNQTLKRIGAASNAFTSRRFHLLLHHLLQRRPGDRPRHGGRPLPDT